MTLNNRLQLLDPVHGAPADMDDLFFDIWCWVYCYFCFYSL